MRGEMPYRWSDTYGARLGVMPRDGSDADCRWYEVDPCYVFHPMNAWEVDGRITLDVCRFPDMWRQAGDFSHQAPPTLHRWLNPNTLRQQFILTELLQKPVALRPDHLADV